MKKITLMIISLLMLASCSGAKEEEKKTEYSENEIVTTSDFEFDITSVRKSYSDSMWLEDNYLYVVVEMSIKNISKEKQSVSTNDWKLQNADLVETEVSNVNSTIGNETFSVDVLPGGTVNAILYFEQPIENSGLVLTYYSNMFNDKPDFKILLSTDCSDDPVKETPYAKEESVKYRDLQYTVTKVQTSTGKDFYKPSTGNVFLGVTITVKNVSAVDVAEISSSGWKIFDDKGVSFDTTYFSGWDTESFYDKQLEPGAEHSYLVAFEVPKSGKWRLAFFGNSFDDKEKFSIQLN